METCEPLLAAYTVLCPPHPPLMFLKKTGSIISDNYKTFFLLLFLLVCVITCSGLYIFLSQLHSFCIQDITGHTLIRKYSNSIGMTSVEYRRWSLFLSSPNNFTGLSLFIGRVYRAQLWKKAFRSSYGGALSWCKCTSWKGGMFSEWAPPPLRAPEGPKWRLCPGLDVASPE